MPYASSEWYTRAIYQAILKEREEEVLPKLKCALTQQLLIP